MLSVDEQYRMSALYAFVFVCVLAVCVLKRGPTVVAKTSGSYSHSNRNISSPRAEFINYAFFKRPLFSETGIKMHAQFPPQHKSCTV